MKFFFLLFTLSFTANAQTDLELIRAVLNDFIEGTTYNYPDKITSGFLPETPMYLHNDQDSLWVVPIEKYASWYARRPPGTPNNRISSILSIDIEKTVAFAKLQVEVPHYGNRYYDLLLLKKIDDAWKVIAKCTSAEPIPKTPTEAMAKPVKEVLMEGLNRPWSMAFLSEKEVIIAEKDGDLLLVDLETQKREKILGLPTDVARAIRIDTSKHEWGVLPPFAHGQTKSYNAGWFQILIDPDFANNPYVYLSYAAENEDRASTTKVVRGKLQGNQLSQIETLLVAAPYSHGLFHYGGGMTFGRDGKLYITVGERNLFEHLNPVPPLSQDIKDKRGKVFRINPDGSIPRDNPDFGPHAVKGLYAMGIRAAQGLAIAPQTGKIWFSEHGTTQGDELNILSPGANYGWPHRTSGKYRSKDYNPPIIPGTEFTDPVYFWDHTVAPTGLCFYQGQEFPQWNGNLIVPGLSKGSLWRMVIKEDKIVSAEELFIEDRVRLRKAIISPRGKLYLLSDEENGKLIRVKNEN